MKILNYLLVLAFALCMDSCTTTSKFPVSNLVPSAEISATQKKDKNGNTVVQVKAKHLASPDRIITSKKIYVVWASTAENGIKNLGQLTNKNAGKAGLKTTTPFVIKELFITAEEQGNISYPSGIEISRTTLK